MIRFRCPGCGSKLRVPTSYMGKPIKCPKCDQAVRVPQPAPQRPAVPETTGRRPESPAAGSFSDQTPAPPGPPQAPLEPAEALAQAAMDEDYTSPPPTTQPPATRRYESPAPPLRRRRKRAGDIPASIIGLGLFLILVAGLMGYFIGRTHMDAIWKNKINNKPPAPAAPPAPKAANPTVQLNKTNMLEAFPAIIPADLKDRNEFLIEHFKAFVIDANDKEKTLRTQLKLKNTSDAKHFFNVTYQFITSGGKVVEERHDGREFDPGGNQPMDSDYTFPLSTFDDFNAVRLRIQVE